MENQENQNSNVSFGRDFLSLKKSPFVGSSPTPGTTSEFGNRKIKIVRKRFCIQSANDKKNRCIVR